MTIHDGRDRRRVAATLAGGSPAASVLQPTLGARLRSLRQETRASLADVASATDMSPSFLSLVESGKSDITISRLLRLARFFDISVSDLVDGAGSDSARMVVRKDEQRALHSEEEGLDVFLLCPDSNRRMSILSVRIAPGKSSDQYSHEGEEFVHVVRGTVVLELEGFDELVLSAGDSVYFDAKIVHQYKNPYKRVAEMFSAMSPPTL
jgi:transcriptional regulator with XRE-family HTH domain